MTSQLFLGLLLCGVLSGAATVILLAVCMLSSINNQEQERHE